MFARASSADHCCRIVLFQLLNCSAYLVIIVVLAWRTFKMEQSSILVFADVVAVLAAAAAMSPAPAPPSSSPQTPSFFSLDPKVVQRARQLMLKCAFQAPSVERNQQMQEYAFIAPLCNSVRDSCAPQIVFFDDDAANGAAENTAEDCTSCSLQDVYSAASALLQRLTLMEAAKSSAHHTIFGIAVDTGLLLSTLSFAISGIASGLSMYGK